MPVAAAPFLLLLLLAPALTQALGAAPPRRAAAAEAEAPDPVVQVPAGDRAMRAAIARARRTLPGFLAMLAAPPAGVSGITFKYPLEGSEADGREYIWVEDVARRGDRLAGRLANVPFTPGYRRGQRVSVPIADVSDWAYRDARGVMRGHYTTRALLRLMDPGEARAIREGFGWTR